MHVLRARIANVLECTGKLRGQGKLLAFSAEKTIISPGRKAYPVCQTVPLPSHLERASKRSVNPRRRGPAPKPSYRTLVLRAAGRPEAEGARAAGAGLGSSRARAAGRIDERQR